MKKTPTPFAMGSRSRIFLARIDMPKTCVRLPGFSPGFVRRNYAALCGYPFRVKLFGPLPSFQDHMDKLEANRRFVAYCGSSQNYFVKYAIPTMTGIFWSSYTPSLENRSSEWAQRRSLMKRALVGHRSERTPEQKAKDT